MKKWKATKIGKIINKRLITSTFYIDKNKGIKNIIIVAGTGRSGTTWLAEILSNHLKYRIIFEPFNPRKVKLCKNFLNKQYIAPTQENETYYNIFKKILAGKIRSRWLNQDNKFFRPKGRIIKTIRANLFLKWFKINFPEIPILFILRHPCAVVASRKQLGWNTSDVDVMIDQADLLNEHLKPYKDIILNAEGSIERNACIWCIENLVALNTMKNENWKITTYENLITQPEEELNNIFKYLNIQSRNKVKQIDKIISVTVKKDSSIFNEKNPLIAWKKILEEEEIKKVLTIVKKFKLDFIYNEDIYPKTENLNNFKLKAK